MNTPALAPRRVLEGAVEEHGIGIWQPGSAICRRPARARYTEGAREYAGALV